jgi:hypothetical protein
LSKKIEKKSKRKVTLEISENGIVITHKGETMVFPDMNEANDWLKQNGFIKKGKGVIEKELEESEEEED